MVAEQKRGGQTGQKNKLAHMNVRSFRSTAKGMEKPSTKIFTLYFRLKRYAKTD